jgi:hypothetical protein
MGKSVCGNKSVAFHADGSDIASPCFAGVASMSNLDLGRFRIVAVQRCRHLSPQASIEALWEGIHFPARLSRGSLVYFVGGMVQAAAFIEASFDESGNPLERTSVRKFQTGVPVGQQKFPVPARHEGSRSSIIRNHRRVTGVTAHRPDVKWRIRY